MTDDRIERARKVVMNRTENTPPTTALRAAAGYTELSTTERAALAPLLKRAWPPHTELDGATLTFVWRQAFAPNVDGHVVLAQVRRPSPVDRVLHGFDAVVVLNQERWAVLTDEQRVALLDHELGHLAPVRAKDGSPAKDSAGNRRWRRRDHDVQEFVGVVKRHGLWNTTLQKMGEVWPRLL